MNLKEMKIKSEQLLKSIIGKKGGKEAILIVLIVLLFLLYFGIPEDSAEEDLAPNLAPMTYEYEDDSELFEVKNKMESELQSILGAISGVGDVKVTLSIENSIETIYEKEESTVENIQEEIDTGGSTRSTVSQNETSKPATVGTSSGEEPLKIKELSPTITGVVVVAEGMVSPITKEEVFEATKVLTGLPSHKIVVLEMKS